MLAKITSPFFEKRRGNLPPIRQLLPFSFFLLIEKHKNVFFVYLALYYLTIFQKTAWYLFAIWREITSKAARFLENGEVIFRFPENAFSRKPVFCETRFLENGEVSFRFPENAFSRKSVVCETRFLENRTHDQTRKMIRHGCLRYAIVLGFPK